MPSKKSPSTAPNLGLHVHDFRDGSLALAFAQRPRRGDHRLQRRAYFAPAARLQSAIGIDPDLLGTELATRALQQVEHLRFVWHHQQMEV